MSREDILNEIAFDPETNRLCTKVWSFTEANAIEKALNRIDFKARSMGREYEILEERTTQQPDPGNPTHIWQCITKALLI